MRIKICGITQSEQASAIAKMGVTALGFICVPTSPRYISPLQIQQIIAQLSPSKIDLIGVFANSTISEICQTWQQTGLTAIQLHGTETREYCQQLKQALPNLEIIKAIRVRDAAALETAGQYAHHVDTLLLDAYHPQMLGGTGHTLDWAMLKIFHPNYPWFLAGGLTPDNVLTALQQMKPTGIDLSSGVEKAPGDKDLTKVAQLLTKILPLTGRKFLYDD